ncbi:DUF456 domain-containing protein [Chitiniphilus eburneus]|uniref:DUF456 domain-containing protein n=1 Tax=Chitiniphilus eburneus TaxID=2571148 RepID=A0A4U0PZE0_9NEIS|nr:DUF456 family protein [Chitiniphilus eburneus]TJZ73042.1 DUF456 domain-containing protein [Chitiniphilus eburneus]
MTELMTAQAGWYLLAAVLVLVGFLGTLLPMLPGTPMIFGGMLVAAWADGFQRVGWLPFIVLGILLLLSIVLDYVAGALGARKYGASKEALWGSILGSLLGIFAGLPGLLLGPFVGAALGEYYARRDLERAGKVGIATWIGLILGAVAKIAVALAMLGVFAVAWFW